MVKNTSACFLSIAAIMMLISRPCFAAGSPDNVKAEKKIIVAHDGSGDVRTVQEAIDRVEDSSEVLTIIFIRNGIYKEKLLLPASKQHVHFIGESVDKTILTCDDYASKKDSSGKEMGTSGSSSFFIFGDDFSAENITFQNSSGAVGQAVAVRVTGDRARFINCRFLGFQDTLYTQGSGSRQYYSRCYIEGAVDFIFGAATCVFDSCTIYGKSGGYYTAASTPHEQPFGYVFFNCKITGDAPAKSFLLGRPWRPYAKVVFMNCDIDNTVKPEGWSNWGKAENEKTAFYAEYNNKGEGAYRSERVPWSHALRKEQAGLYTIDNIFRGWDPVKNTLKENVSLQQGRTVIDLSAKEWKLWLDTAATWLNDTLYAPPVNVSRLPVHLPTGGWESLERAHGRKVQIPATVEQYYWGMNGNPFGVGGNYLGVSWWTTGFSVPALSKGKRITLNFDAVRFRAEVFVNRQLVAYDLVNSTPFEVDVTDYVKYGAINELAVRITDPNGNFDWRDSQNFMWGNYRTNPTHGFGGITGKVKLVMTDKIFTSDVYVKNKPVPRSVDVQVNTRNLSGQLASGSLTLQVKEAAGGKIVFERKYPLKNIKNGDNVNTYPIVLKKAKLWSIDSPDLYLLTVSWHGNDGTTDTYQQRFGFRWFEVRDLAGDKQYYLNGKRIVLLSAISWGFWPLNGIAPSDELARKQVEDAKKIGLNMLNFHRTIGQRNVLDYADELGLLYFEEPGGNQYPADRFDATDPFGKMQADFYFATRNEKLFRMIRRDRNHPSLVIYNMHNERGAEPRREDREQMLAAHRLDETRIITYNSSNGPIKQGPDPRFKLHLHPYDFTFRDYGWFDQHHAGGPGTYHDNLYKHPNDYLRYTNKRDEIIYYGEEGAIGTPPRLQLIRDEILKTGKEQGWETFDYLNWYAAYDSFLRGNPGFLRAYPNVDSLTTAIGNVAYYYQGRIIENVRINNTIDGYAINGWESMKLENHSGIVDNYRNLKGDPSLISRYTKPLFVSVKLNHKVLATGDTAIADFFIVNEKDLTGDFILNIKVQSEKNELMNKKSIPVRLSGGHVYGELLYAGFPVVPTNSGYCTVSAELVRNGQGVAQGEDLLYAVSFNKQGIPADGMVADTTGVLSSFLQAAGIPHSLFTSGRPSGKYLLVGAFQPQQTGNPLVTEILEWVNEGGTLIVVNNTEPWAAFLARKEVLEYRGSQAIGTSWYGGNFFSQRHRLFEGLPQSQVFNWEYQCFATYNKNRIGLRLLNGEPVVAVVADHKKEVYTALSVVPHGRGRIILSTLDIFSCLKDIKTVTKAEGDGENAAMITFDALHKAKANVVGQQLLLNMLKYSK